MLGFGGRSQGAEAAGYSITVAVDQNRLRLDQHGLVYAAHCLCGDTGDRTMILDFWSPSRGASIVSCGFGCRPLSRLGDCKGQFDSRACCLTQSSNAVLYLTVACVILECAAPAAHDSSPSLTSIDFAKSLGFTLHRLSLYMIMCGLADGTAHGGFVPCLMVVCFICDHGLR